MACEHKFIDYLNLDRLDFKPTTLIVGTFNPAWPEENFAQWFYGRIRGRINDYNKGNHFWAVLPRLYGQASLKFLGAENQWKAFCQEHKIAITDLIYRIEDAYPNNHDHLRYLTSYSDRAIISRFKKQAFVSIIEILQSNPTIKNIYLTRGIGDIFWLQKWRPVQAYCDANGIRHRTLLTPSDYAFYQQGQYNNLHPEAPLNREDFILMRWQQQWHQI